MRSHSLLVSETDPGRPSAGRMLSPRMERVRSVSFLMPSFRETRPDLGRGGIVKYVTASFPLQDPGGQGNAVASENHVSQLRMRGQGLLKSGSNLPVHFGLAGAFRSTVSIVIMHQATLTLRAKFASYRSRISLVSRDRCQCRSLSPLVPGRIATWRSTSPRFLDTTVA